METICSDCVWELQITLSVANQQAVYDLGIIHSLDRFRRPKVLFLVSLKEHRLMFTTKALCY